MTHGRIRTRPNTSNNTGDSNRRGPANRMGFGQSGNPFDARKLLTSAIIAVVLSLTVVGTVIGSIPEGQMT